VDPPPDIFDSPEAKAADHIPKPLPSDEVRTAPGPKKPAGPERQPAAKTDLERAWELYNRSRYPEAAEFFRKAVRSNPRRSLNARMGLSYSLLKQSRRTAAIGELKYLVKRKYRLQETLPLLLDLLIDRGELDAAAGYLPMLPAAERKRWTRRVLTAELTGDHRRLKNKSPLAGADDWERFVSEHHQALEMCIRPDIFFDAATRFKGAQQRKKAISIQRSLLSCNPAPDLRLGIVAWLSNRLDPAAALVLLEEEKIRFKKTAPQRLPDIERLRLAALKRQLDTPGMGTEEKMAAARAVLELDPLDKDATGIIAWGALEQKNYEASQAGFEKLLRLDPANREYALGLGYSRLNLGRYDDALEPLEASGLPDDDRSLALKSLVYKALARQAFDRQDWPTAAENLEAALSIDPNDTEAKSLLAWTRFHQDRREEAQALMESTYDRQPDAAAAGQLLDLYQSGPETYRSRSFAIEMAGDGVPATRKKAADYLFSQKAPVTAAQVDAAPDACYRGAASPRLEAFVTHKNKTGDDGTSKLAETSFPTTLVYPTRWGNQWSLSATPRHLSSGDAPDTPFAGRFYRFLNGDPQKNDLEDGIRVWQPDVGLEKEGPLHISAHLGTSPIGGAVDPTPTLSLRLSAADWFADLHRCTVKDSILSYTGLEDPYGSGEWGRVLRNGIAAGITRPVLTDYWMTIAGGYDFYTGKNLWGNSSVHLNAAAGKTFDHNGDEMTLGVFFTGQHYRRNSDFYTYGHGGYYSPELMTLVGPFFRYRSALCRSYWFDIQLSAGWLHQRLDGSPVYPEFDGDVSGLTPAAAADALAEYEGETDNKLGLSAKIQGMKLLTEHLALGGFAGVDNNADFTRWQLGVGLQFFFEKQNAFWQRRDFFTDFGDCSNR
jgi:tetratricopeptide (TPR) repeat protein